MRTMGLIGGMSWESTARYYHIVNTVVKEQLGGLHSAQCVLYSVDFAAIESLQTQGRWEESGQLLAAAAQACERAGAEFLVLCTNTMHKVAPHIEAAVNIPFLHIADATAQEMQRAGIHKAALLGTRYTMEQDFYRARLEAQGMEVVIPAPQEREEINRIIFEELCLGKIEASSKAYFLRVMDECSRLDAQGIILGCTEIGLLVTPQDTPLPLLDTASLHARQAALYALNRA